MKVLVALVVVVAIATTLVGATRAPFNAQGSAQYNHALQPTSTDMPQQATNNQCDCSQAAVSPACGCGGALPQNTEYRAFSPSTSSNPLPPVADNECVPGKSCGSNAPHVPSPCQSNGSGCKPVTAPPTCAAPNQCHQEAKTTPCQCSAPAPAPCGCPVDQQQPIQATALQGGAVPTPTPTPTTTPSTPAPSAPSAPQTPAANNTMPAEPVPNESGKDVIKSDGSESSESSESGGVINAAKVENTESDGEWGYSQGGADWKDVCQNGKSQSPINIDPDTLEKSAAAANADGNGFRFFYHKLAKMELENNGNALVIRGNLGLIKRDGDSFNVLRIEFHSPAEHIIDNKTFPLEAQVYHQKDGSTGSNDIVAFSVLFDEGPQDNPFLFKVNWDNAPLQKGSVAISNSVDLSLFDSSLKANNYAYQGSLTTPNCDESVEWHVSQYRQTVSRNQLEKIQKIFRGSDYKNGNARDAQSIGNRKVYLNLIGDAAPVDDKDEESSEEKVDPSIAKDPEVKAALEEQQKQKAEAQKEKEKEEKAQEAIADQTENMKVRIEEEKEESEEKAQDTSPPVLNKTDARDNSPNQPEESSEEKPKKEEKKCEKRDHSKCIHININNVNNLGQNNGKTTQQQGNISDKGPRNVMSIGGVPLKWDYSRNGNDWTGLCETGKKQSPVNIDTKEAERVGGKNKRMQFYYKPLKDGLVKNDNSKALIVDASRQMGYMEGGDERYELIQLNFHTRSEHTIDGRQFDVELHIVHQKSKAKGTDELLVIALMFKVDTKAGDNDFLAQIIGKGLPEANTDGKIPSLDLSSLDEALRGPNFVYSGSLTAPDCTEDVEWHIIEDVQSMSTGQYDEIRKAITNNQREVQPLNGRKVYRVA